MKAAGTRRRRASAPHRSGYTPNAQPWAHGKTATQVGDPGADRRPHDRERTSAGVKTSVLSRGRRQGSGMRPGGARVTFRFYPRARGMQRKPGLLNPGRMLNI